MNKTNVKSSKSAEMKRLIKLEYTKCATNPVYFMKKYCIILHPKRGLIKFDLYDFQTDTVSEFLKYRWNIILKARQLGISTLTSAYATWLMLFHDNKTILIIANKTRVANSMVYKINTIYKLLPKWLKRMAEDDNGKLPVDTKSKLRFRNGSTVEASSATEDAGRSDALSLLIWDECAIVKENLAREIWTSASNTLAEGGDCVILSTPKGVGNIFHELWVDAEAGENEFNTIKLPWHLHPNRGQDYRDKADRKMGKKAAAQEHDCLWGKAIIEVFDTLTNTYKNITLEELYNE